MSAVSFVSWSFPEKRQVIFGTRPVSDKMSCFVSHTHTHTCTHTHTHKHKNRVERHSAKRENANTREGFVRCVKLLDVNCDVPCEVIPRFLFAHVCPNDNFSLNNLGRTRASPSSILHAWSFCVLIKLDARVEVTSPPAYFCHKFRPTTDSHSVKRASWSTYNCVFNQVERARTPRTPTGVCQVRDNRDIVMRFGNVRLLKTNSTTKLLDKSPCVNNKTAFHAPSYQSIKSFKLPISWGTTRPCRHLISTKKSHWQVYVAIASLFKALQRISWT